MPIGIRRSHIQGHGAQQHRSDWNFVICGTCRPVAVRFLHPLVPSDGGAANPAVRRSGRLVNVRTHPRTRSGIHIAPLVTSRD